MNAEKFMTLMYITDEMQKQYPQVILYEGNWNPELYYIVRQMPLVEMLHQDPAQLAEELVEMTNSPDWRAQSRRPVGVGDVFCCGLIAWMYAHTKVAEEINKRISMPLPAVTLAAWPDFTIINLPISIDSVKEMLCRLST
jgi:hypothetical protein